MHSTMKRLGVPFLMGLAGLVAVAAEARADSGTEDAVGAIRQDLQRGGTATARQRAEQLTERLQTGGDRWQEAETLTRVGLQFKDGGDAKDAERYFALALTGWRAFNPPEHSSVAYVELNLSRVWVELEDYAEARRHLQRCKEAVDAAGRERSTRRKAGQDVGLAGYAEWGRWEALADVEEKTGQYRAAEAACQQSVDHFTKTGKPVPPRDPDDRLAYALGIGRRGWVRFAWARDLLVRKTRTERPGTERTPVPEELLRLAEQDLRAAQQLKEGLPEKQRAKAWLAETLNNLALVLYFQGRFAEAEQDFGESLDLLKKDGRGEANLPLQARYLHNLGSLLRSEGKPAEAVRFHKESLRIVERVKGPEHPDVGATHAYLAWDKAAGAQPDLPGAALDMDEARHIFRRHLRNVLSAQAESEQLTFLETKDRPQLHAALTLGVRAEAAREARRLPEAQARKVLVQSAEWLINGKGLTLDVLGERIVRAGRSADPQVKTTYAALRRVRGELAARALRQPPRDGTEDPVVVNLSREETRLSQQLGVALGSGGEDPWVDLAQVQRLLATDPRLQGKGVFIDIARFPLIDFQSKGTDFVGKEEHYTAWVVPPEGPVKVFDLGPADAIDGAARALRADIERQYKDRQIDEAGETRFRQRSAALGRLLLGPMYDYVSDYDRWIVSPDGDLWLVPWAALVLPVSGATSPYAVEKHTISLVASGRDLVAPRRRTAVRRGPPLILADPEFGEAPDGRSPRFGFPQLAITSQEANEVAPLLARYTRTPADAVVLKLDKDAREAAFRSVRSPKALVFGTHGFFLPDTMRGVPSNPLLRCGLALAGANLIETRPASAQAAADDGILLGEEILETDLSGTDLVVLSACETAVGTVRDGEGVANLQSAFRIAGAETVVATLWQVPDLNTALLMREFFRNLAAGKDKAEALQQAQATRIRQLREGRDRAAHPFRWAAVTVTGQWRVTLDN
jgi:CHAT domain-containing protein/tetratricopeptide (TPR) repeat protein